MFKKDLGLFLLILVVGATVAILNPLFLTTTNFSNTANQIGLYGLISLAQAFVIITGGIELSVGSIIALLGVIFVVMLTVQLIPGDAVALMLGEHATPEAVAKLRDYLGLDKPLLVRYVEYVKRLVTGDLGRSIQQNRPVVDELADTWPATQCAMAPGVIACSSAAAAQTT